MAEGARLESVYTLIAYRGFESLSLRQNTNPAFAGFLFLDRRGFDENPWFDKTAGSGFERTKCGPKGERQDA